MGLAAWKHDNQNQYEEVTGAKTLDEGDGGVTQVVTVTATLTLPATVAGTTYRIVNGSDQVGKVGVTVSPNASDKIMGNGFTSADDKDAINTLATAEPGDELVLVGDGTNGWQVSRVKGVWARQA